MGLSFKRRSTVHVSSASFLKLPVGNEHRHNPRSRQHLLRINLPERCNQNMTSRCFAQKYNYFDEPGACARRRGSFRCVRVVSCCLIRPIKQIYIVRIVWRRRDTHRSPLRRRSTYSIRKRSEFNHGGVVTVTFFQTSRETNFMMAFRSSL
jgi:hypothetical protein